MKEVTLLLREAVDLHARENFIRDMRLGLDPNEDEFPLYVEEAEYILKTTGEGFIPDFPDHHMIYVENK